MQEYDVPKCYCDNKAEDMEFKGMTVIGNYYPIACFECPKCHKWTKVNLYE